MILKPYFFASSLLLFLSAFLYSGQCLAQVPFSAISYGGTDLDRDPMTRFDAYGNSYTLGAFKGTTDFDPGPGVHQLSSNVERDLYILKLDHQGNFQWVKQIGNYDQEHNMAFEIDGSGALIAMGTFYNTVDFDPGPGVHTLTPSTPSGGSNFILKLDSAGNFLWVKDSYRAQMITVDVNGNIYCSSSLTGTMDFDPGPGVYNITSAGNTDVVISKLNASGTFLWAKSFGGNDIDLGQIVGFDPHANALYLSGRFYFNSDLAPGPGTYPVSSFINPTGNTYLSKLDSSGNLIWARVFTDSSGMLDIFKAVTDSLGNLYLGGTFNDSLDFDPGPGVEKRFSTGIGDAFVVRMDTAGVFQWVTQVAGPGNERTLVITPGDSGTVYISGDFEQTADADPSPATFALTSAGQKDIFLAKYSYSGSLIWADRYGSSWYDQVSTLTRLANGNIYMDGEFYGSSITFGATTLNNNFNYFPDVFMTRLTVCAGPPDSLAAMTGDSTVCPNTTQVYRVPPTTGADIYFWTLPLGWVGSSLSDSIVVSTGAGPDSGLVTVIAVNACGISNISTMMVRTLDSPAVIINLSGNTLNSVASFSGYQWLLNGSAVAGATGSSHTAVTNGNYSLIATDSNGCTGVSNIINVVVSGIADITGRETATIFPNPSTGTVTIRAVRAMSSINVRDMLGREVRSLSPGTNETLISELGTGVYLVEVRTGNEKTILKKLVVQ